MTGRGGHEWQYRNVPVLVGGELEGTPITSITGLDLALTPPIIQAAHASEPRGTGHVVELEARKATMEYARRSWTVAQITVHVWIDRRLGDREAERAFWTFMLSGLDAQPAAATGTV